MLANLPADYVSQIVDYVGLPAYTRETTTDPDELKQELEEIRECGYAVSDCESALGVQSVGIALESHGRVHALGVFGYSHDVSGLTQDHDIPTVLADAAKDIEEAV
jgi:IclR family acetate operon transcriptional repressor